MNFIVRAHHYLPIKKGSTNTSGFTLLELIGVMVVIAILTAAVLPSTIDLLQVQRSVNEGGKLPQVAEALKRGMLREQVFPIYENGTEDNNISINGDKNYWWNIAARHGGGSASDVRYPLGVRPKSDNTRKLYFQSSWDEKTFFEITSDGLSWLSNPLDPRELRMLLLSTTSSDLPLPDELDDPYDLGTLDNNTFNALWDDWAIGSGGNPVTGENSWSRYGLNAAKWRGRATELNIQRIDLREWLSRVVIENHRAIQAAPGDSFDISGYPDLSGDWVSGSLYAYTENQAGSSVIFSSTDTTNGSPPNQTSVSQIDKVIFTKRGKVVDENSDVVITVSGTKISGTPPVTSQSSESVTITLTQTDYAPVSLLNPYDIYIFTPLSGWGIVGDFFIYRDFHFIDRYFLLGQELLLGEPWGLSEVGTFIINEAFSTLRFDGLQWEY